MVLTNQSNSNLIFGIGKETNMKVSAKSHNTRHIFLYSSFYCSDIYVIKSDIDGKYCKKILDLFPHVMIIPNNHALKEHRLVRTSHTKSCNMLGS